MYIQKACEANIEPYNTVVSKLLQSALNVQFISSAYAVLTYLTLYLCKIELTMSKLLKKHQRKGYVKNVRSKMHFIGNIFLTKYQIIDVCTLLPVSKKIEIDKNGFASNTKKYEN